MPRDRRLGILAAAHVALGLVTGVLAAVELRTPMEFKHILIVPYLASAFCQSFLLSLWGAASQAMLWKRLAGLVAGALYLEAIAPRDFSRECPGICMITIAVSTASLLVVKWSGVRLRRQVDPGQPARLEPERLWFSIRGMMLFTAAVALLCAGARALQAPQILLVMTLVWAMCLVVVGLVALWAALGAPRDAPLRRGPAVFVLSPVLGAYLALPATPAGRVYILLIMVLYPTALLGSLLIVRSCGYRLVRRAFAEWIGLLGSGPARQEGSPLPPSPSQRPVG
jgi:hypothetical protein